MRAMKTMTSEVVAAQRQAHNTVAAVHHLEYGSLHVLVETQSLAGCAAVRRLLDLGVEPGQALVALGAADLGGRLVRALGLLAVAQAMNRPWLTSAMLLLVAAVHLLPLLGVLSVLGP